ncbi:MAG: hypothetical protein ABI254_05435, partial [Chthoniobacterales bacterium]
SLDTTNGILGTNILGPLTNNNPRGIIFLDAPFQKRGKGGITTNTPAQYVDPWGTPYKIALSSAGFITNPASSDNGVVGAAAGTPGSKHVAVWSTTGTSNTNINLTTYSW